MLKLKYSLAKTLRKCFPWACKRVGVQPNIKAWQSTSDLIRIETEFRQQPLKVNRYDQFITQFNSLQLLSRTHKTQSGADLTMFKKVHLPLHKRNGLLPNPQLTASSINEPFKSVITRFNFSIISIAKNCRQKNDIKRTSFDHQPWKASATTRTRVFLRTKLTTTSFKK